MRYLTTAELAEVTGVAIATLKILAADRAIRPAWPKTRGVRRENRYSLMQATALVVARACRKRGASLASADAVRAYLWRMQPERFEFELSEGRAFIAISGETALPRLMPWSAVFANADVDYEAMREAGVLPAAVHAGAAQEAVKRRADEAAAKRGGRARRHKDVSGLE